jgi:TetR/AcrR family transcriptional regulator, cholesterol catabolism regulator
MSAFASAVTAEEKRPRGRPRKTLQTQSDGNRRAELVRAAGRLFRRKGFDATSTRDIASAVGMRSGSPFYHFKSKGALLYEVMRQGMEDATRQQTAALAAATLSKKERSTQFPRRLLAVLIRNHFDILLGEGADFIPVMLYEWRSLNARQRGQVARIKDEYEAAWMPVLIALQKTGQLQAEARVARLMIFGALNWAVQWYDPKFEGEGSMDLDKLTEQAVALFIHKEPT